MSKTVDDDVGSDLAHEGGLPFPERTPEVVICDSTSLTRELQRRLEDRSWVCTVIEDEEDPFTHLIDEQVDCLVIDPAAVVDPVELVRRVREDSEVPVIVWGNDLGSDDVRQLAGISNTDYVPKPTQEDGRVFCLTSLNQPLDNSPGTSVPKGSESDDLVVSMITHAVREFWMAERVETQLDAMENSLSGIAILDEDYEIIYSNQTLADLLGYDSTDIIVGNSSQMCFPHHEIGRFCGEIQSRVCETGEWRGGIDCRRMDGSIFPTHLSVSRIGGEKYILTIEDMSEQQVLQEELEEFRGHIGQGYLAVSSDLLISQVNGTATNLFEVQDKGALVGESLFEFWLCDIEEELRERFATVDTTGEGVSVSLEVDSLDMWLEIRVHPLDQGYALYLRDVTEEKERQRQLAFASEFVKQSTDSYVVYEVDSGVVVDANSTANKWLGIGKEDLIGMDVVEVVNYFSEDEDGFTMADFEEFCAAARDGGVVVEDVHYGPPAGSTYPVDAYASCVTVDGVEYLVIAGDVHVEGGASDSSQDGPNRVAESFLDNCLDPTSYIDPETGEIMEVNQELVEFTGLSRDEVLGSQYRRLFADEVAGVLDETYSQLLRDGGGRFRRCSDGSYARIRTSDNDSIPAELGLGTLDMGGDIANLLVFRSIEDDVRNQRSFEMVNQMTHELVQEDSPDDIADLAADAIKEMPVFMGSVVYLYDDSEGVLEAAAYNEPAENAIEGIRTFAPGDGLIWNVYSDSDPLIPEGDWLCSYSEGEVAVPIGTHGVLFVCCPFEVSEAGIIPDIANIVASSIESALDRAETISELRRNEREANLKKQQLEYVSDLNERIRSLNEALVQAESKETIKEDVCNELVGLDDFDGILFADVETTGSRVEPTQSRGISDVFLEQMPFSSGGGELPPTVQAAEKQASVEVSNIPSRAQEEEWAAVALEHEYKSAISIPIKHGAISYGVVTIYSNLSGAFDGRTKPVLEELGSLVAYACHAVTSRAALGSDSGIDLSFTIGADGPLSQLAEMLGTTLTVQNATPANDSQHHLIHAHIEDVDSDVVSNAVESLGVVDDLRMIGDPETGIYEFKIEDPGGIAKIVDLGAPLQSAVVSPEETEVIVSLPANRDRGEFISRVKDQLSDIELRASQEGVDTDTIPWTHLLREPLTEKQETALRTAYYVGYFDSPSKTNGRELAERLGLTQGTISYRLRAAQRNLFETLWGEQEHQIN